MRPPQFTHHLGIREPFRYFFARHQALTQLAAGNSEGAAAGRNSVFRQVAGPVCDVHHLVRRHHLDAEFLFVPMEHRLCIVRPVERVALRVLAGARMIPTDDQVGASVIPSHDGVREHFTRSRHAHGERQQRKYRRSGRVLPEGYLIATDPGEMVHVAGLGRTDRRLD
jgi:hypothetical protein